MPYSMAFGLHYHFCTNDHIARMYSKIACNISSGSYGVCVQVIQPSLKFTYQVIYILTFTHRPHLNASFAS